MDFILGMVVFGEGEKLTYALPDLNPRVVIHARSFSGVAKLLGGAVIREYDSELRALISVPKKTFTANRSNSMIFEKGPIQFFLPPDVSWTEANFLVYRAFAFK